MAVNGAQVPAFVEVTNTLGVGHTTGVQRLTREILGRLPGPDSDGELTVTPIVWDPAHEKYRRLTSEEQSRLDVTPAPTDAGGRRLAWLPEPLRAGLKAGRNGLRALRPGSPPAATAHLVVDPLPEGAVWLDLEAAWHGPVPREELLSQLWAFGIPTAVMLPDVMPLLWPEWFEERMVRRFRRYVTAHLRRSRTVLCISHTTEADVRRVGESIAPGREHHTAVAPMGADHRRVAAAASLPGELVGRRYLLAVGTIEPRKNHELLLDVFDRLAADHPDVALVFVGKAGWKVEPLVERITTHPRFRSTLLWYRRLDDATLETVYGHAHLACTPSRYEGFGIPVVEALAHGVPVISSDGGALPETGGDRATYLDPDDVDGWTAAIRRHLVDPRHHAAARAALADYRPPSWDDCASVVARELVALGRS